MVKKNEIGRQFVLGCDVARCRVRAVVREAGRTASSTEDPELLTWVSRDAVIFIVTAEFHLCL